METAGQTMKVALVGAMCALLAMVGYPGEHDPDPLEMAQQALRVSPGQLPPIEAVIILERPDRTAIAGDPTPTEMGSVPASADAAGAMKIAHIDHWAAFVLLAPTRGAVRLAGGAFR